jgi:hypothetical protein
MGKIRLTGATSGYTEIQAASAAGNNTIILPTTNGGQVIVSDSSGNVNIDSGTFYVDASNNRVGIGTTSPSQLLHLNSATAVSTYTLYQNPNTQTFIGANAAGDTIIYNDTAARSVAFFTNATERGRWDPSGRLLVGTSSSRPVYTGNYSSQLQIEGSGTGAGRGSLSVINNAAGSNPVFIALGKSNANSIGGTTLVANGEWLGNIAFQGTDGTNMVPAAYIDCYVDGTPGANDMPGRLVFSTTADGASSPTEQLRITSDRYVRLASGTGGIQFNGDTAAANALDDYEEGTFTPTLSSGFSSGPTSYAYQDGRYTKIGRFVFFQINIQPTGAVASASHWKLGGLPFSVSAVTGGAYIVYQASANTNSLDVFLTNTSSTTIDVFTSAGGVRNGNDAGVNINARLILVGSYIA